PIVGRAHRYSTQAEERFGNDSGVYIIIDDQHGAGHRFLLHPQVVIRRFTPRTLHTERFDGPTPRKFGSRPLKFRTGKKTAQRTSTASPGIPVTRGYRRR